MFIFALFLGFYSYIIFFLGITGLLYQTIIIPLTIVFLCCVFIWKRKILLFDFHLKNKGVWFLVSVLVFQVGINLIGVFGPEYAFDAVWYHLTLPKLYLQNHVILFYPGGLLYYSAMPKLAEMLYTAGLAFGSEVIPKFVHFGFGILTGIVIYQFARKYFSQTISFLAVIIFYSNLVVAWESITAYIDLTRTFFETLALVGFINWFETQKKKWFVLSAVMIGLAITTKLLAIGSLLLFSCLLVVGFFLHKKKLLSLVAGLLLYWLIALSIALPWFIFSYFHTGNPVYPFFTQLYDVVPSSSNPVVILQDMWGLFVHASDPLSPIYLIFLPLLVVCFKRFTKELKLLSVYSVLALLLWYFTPRTGGGRFMVPYLPALSILCAACISWFNGSMKKILIGLVIFGAVITSGYRLAANSKYIPVIIGRETKAQFLTQHLTFTFGDFFDTDGFFHKHIKSSDTVLLYGFHNLFYVNFPFIDATWVKKGDEFTYIATQKRELPEKYRNWQLVYQNDKTMVKLYKAPTGACDKKCIY